MSACTVQTFARAVPITLGLRVGVVGSDGFTSWVRGVIQMDSDVASVEAWAGLASCSTSTSLNLLVVDTNSIAPSLAPETAEALAGFSLIGVVGPTSQALGSIGNVVSIDMTSPDWWLHLKQQTVQRRLQEFSVLINALAGDTQTTSTNEQTLILEDGGQSQTVPVSSVDWIRAAGNYVEIRVNGRSHLLRSEMHALQNRLTRAFLRIHRRVIINTQRLVGIEADSSAKLFAILTTGDRFPISRARRQIVRNRWEELQAHAQ